MYFYENVPKHTHSALPRSDFTTRDKDKFSVLPRNLGVKQYSIWPAMRQLRACL